MAQAKRALKRKRQSKAISMLGIVGVSLAASSGGSVAGTPSRNTVTLSDEEITDVSLATFHVYDENLGTLRSGMRLARGCAACGACRGCGGCFLGRATCSTAAHFWGGQRRLGRPGEGARPVLGPRRQTRVPHPVVGWMRWVLYLVQPVGAGRHLVGVGGDRELVGHLWRQI